MKKNKEYLFYYKNELFSLEPFNSNKKIDLKVVQTNGIFCLKYTIDGIGLIFIQGESAMEDLQKTIIGEV